MASVNIGLLKETVESLVNQRGESKTKVFINSGVGKDFFSNLNKGQIPSVEKIMALADYLGVSVDYLLGRTDNPNSCNNVSNVDTTISGTQINGNQTNIAQQCDSSLAEIEKIISNLPKASKHRAIADMLDVLEKYT